ncbi:MAG TPA: tRNA preQ1(34) S-adenosylmethionine ribosyltransferase-isomerase QueA [Acidimicrobiales bacterium]
MRVDEFDYDLPPDRIAQQPLAERDGSRMLVDSTVTGGAIEHRLTRDLPEYLRPGDVLVLNDTRVLPARVRFRRPSGGASEVLLLEDRGDGWWEALARPSAKLKPGLRVEVGPDLAFELGDDLGEGRRLVRPITTDLLAALDAHGEMPLPPYIGEPLTDPDRYQTVYARRPASAAAPTAGLHLTPAVLERCESAGATIACVELVVGLDTFRPIGVEDVTQHAMHTEHYRVPDTTWRACRDAARVVAVGTTVVRALESVAARGALEGRTDLFIHRPYEFQVVDLLLTNFHLPRSSLLVLVDAFVGPRWRELYELAKAEGYRFLSFGDAMLLGRSTAQGASS